MHWAKIRSDHELTAWLLLGFREESMASGNDRGLAALETTDLGHFIAFDESTKDGREAKRTFERYQEDIKGNKSW